MQPEILIFSAPICSWRAGVPETFRNPLGNRDRTGIGERAIIEARTCDDIGHEPGMPVARPGGGKVVVKRLESSPRHAAGQVLLMADATSSSEKRSARSATVSIWSARGVAGDAADRLQRDGHDA
jgi:hypothetical protein